MVRNFSKRIDGESLTRSNFADGLAKRSEHRSLRTNEHGATMMEYVLIVCCLMLVAISSVSYVGAETRDTFVNVKAGLAHSNVPTGVTPPVIP